MDLKHLLLLAVQVSIVTTVFGFGLRTTLADLLYVVRRPGLLARSLLAVFVVMPIAAVLLATLLDFPEVVQVVLIALAISPVPPILPNKEKKAGGSQSFGLGLMAILALTSIVTAPAALQLLAVIFNRPIAIMPSALAGMVLRGALAPLAAGLIVRAWLPVVAARIERPVSLIGKVLLPVAALALIVPALPVISTLIGGGALVALVTFVVAGLAIGHLLGGPDPDDSVVLALSTACRHPAMALAIATTNAPEQHFGPIILLYLLVNGIVAFPYLKWQERQISPPHGVIRA
jgi:bile acid:Na+ symporter, BASS family